MKRIISALLILGLISNIAPVSAIELEVSDTPDVRQQYEDEDNKKEPIEDYFEDNSLHISEENSAYVIGDDVQLLSDEIDFPYNSNSVDDNVMVEFRALFPWSMFGYPNYPIEHLSDNIYYTNISTNGTSPILVTAPGYYELVFNLPDAVTITDMWDGKGDVFDLHNVVHDGPDVIPAVYKDGTQTVINFFAAAEYDNVYHMKQHSYGGCFYFRLSNGKVYTLVVDDSRGSILADQIALFDANHKQLLSDEYAITNIGSNSAGTSTFVRGKLPKTDEDILLCAQVKNAENHGDLKMQTTGQWRESAENWIMLNGERVPGTFSSSTESEDVFSAPFTLQKGLNVIEVYSNTGGFSINANSQWNWFNPWDSRTISAVYLLEYEGEPADLPEESADVALNTQMSSAYLTAEFSTTNDPTTYTKVPLVKQTDGSFNLFGIPEKYMMQPASVSSACTQGILLNLVPNSPNATITIEGPDNIFAGNVGSLFAVNLCNVEDDSFNIVVTAGDGKTTATYPVQIVRTSSDITAALSFSEAALVSEAGKVIEFDSNVTSYYLQYFGDTTEITINSDVGGLQVDGVNLAGSTAQLSSSKDFHILTVIAEDGVTKKDYYLVTMLPDGTIPYFTISPETKQQAIRMLSSFWEEQAKAEYFSSYWLIFEAFAAGSGVDEYGNMFPYDFNGKSVYNVSEHGMQQATDVAACILELVMLGQNPYDFPGYDYTFRKDENGNYVTNSGGGYLIESKQYNEHANYVALLQEIGGGPWANNQWYVMAAKAVGIEPRYTESLISKSLDGTQDLDMRSWAIAALNGLDGITRTDMVRYIEGLHDAQMTDTSANTGNRTYKGLFQNNVNPGTLWPNSFTIGCTLTAIAASGVDPDSAFAYTSSDGNTYYPLDQVEKYLFNSSDGKFANSLFQGSSSTFSYVKDMIIGLGDIINGSNVWVRYQLTEEKYKALIDKAGKAGVNTSGMPGFGEGDYGRAYYELYDLVFEKTQDRSMRPDVAWGMPYQNFENTVEELGDIMRESGITEASLDDVKEAIDQYEALDEDNRKAVSQTTLETYQTAVKAALFIKDSTGKSAEIYERILALPDPSMADLDDYRTEIEALLDACGLPKAGEDEFTPSAGQQAIQDNMNWAGASVLERLIAARDKLGAATISITFALLGAPDDGEDGTVNTYSRGNLQTWLPAETYEITNLEPTAEDMFRYVMDEVKHVQWEGDSNSGFGSLYISGVRNPNSPYQWMREFTTGPNSGWMYLIIEEGHEAGTYPNVGMTNWDLHDGDTMIFHYTDDYTLEDGGLEVKLRELTNLIRQLPDASEIKYDNYENYIEDVEEIRALYDSLDKTLQNQIDKDLINKFLAVEAKVKFYLEIDDVKDLLTGLPGSFDTDIRPTDRVTKRMNDIAYAYLKLTKAQQEYITARDAEQYMAIREWFLSAKFAKESELPEMGSALLPEPLNGRVYLTPTSTVDSSGHAAVKVETSVLNKAITLAKDDTSVFTIDVLPAGVKDASSIAVELPRTGLTAIADNGRFTLSVQTYQGRIDLINSVLNTLSSQLENAGLTVSFANQTPEQGSALLNGRSEADTDQLQRTSVTEVTLTSGTTNITSWGDKKITLYLPVDPEQFQEGKEYTVYQISGDSSLEQYTAKCADEEDGLFIHLTTSHLSTFVVVPEAKPALPFTDVKVGDWFYDAVAYVTRAGLFTGIDAKTFAPNTTMSRSMLVMVLWRAEGEPKLNQNSAFDDVAPGQWYYNAVVWADSNSVVNGTGNGFDPNGDVTREQIAAILYRYAKIKGWDVSASADLNDFPDGAETAEWAVRAMEWAYAQGLITGKDTGRLDPQGWASRAEVATILMRLLEKQ